MSPTRCVRRCAMTDEELYRLPDRHRPLVLGATPPDRERRGRSSSTSRPTFCARPNASASANTQIARAIAAEQRRRSPAPARAADRTASSRSTVGSITCAAEFVAPHALPLLRPTRRRPRARPHRSPQGDHSWAAGPTASARHRIRLLLRARRLLGAARAGISRRSWSIATPRPCRPTTTPPDRLYFEPLTFEDTFRPILRRARKRRHARGRHRAVWSGRLPLKLARPLSQRRRAGCSAPAPTPSTAPRIASASTALVQARPAALARRHRAGRRRRVPRRREIRLPGARATVVRARRSRHDDLSHDTDLSGLRGARGVEARAEPNSDDPRRRVLARGHRSRRRLLWPMEPGRHRWRHAAHRRSRVHSGDSTSVLPPHSLPSSIIASIEEQTRQLALSSAWSG